MRVLILISLLLIANGVVFSTELLEEPIASARAACGKLGQALMGRLTSAIQSGGPESALSVCRDEAPAIAATVSRDNNLQVGRTALRVRNPENRPDAWEQDVLEAFARQIKDGRDPATMEHWEVVSMNNRRVFRYMKAIPTKGMCLNCHGSEIQSGISEKLRALYPEDQATGFAEGELRGAFTVRIELPAR